MYIILVFYVIRTQNAMRSISLVSRSDTSPTLVYPFDTVYKPDIEYCSVPDVIVVPAV